MYVNIIPNESFQPLIATNVTVKYLGVSTISDNCLPENFSIIHRLRGDLEACSSTYFLYLFKRSLAADAKGLHVQSLAVNTVFKKTLSFHSSARP